MIDQLICPFFGTCTDSQNRSTLSTKLFFCQFMIWTGLQQRIVDRYTFQLLQCLGKPESVITDPLHTKTKCLHPDNIQISVHRSQTAAHVSPDSVPQFHKISKLSVFLIFLHSRITFRTPGKVSAVNDNSTDGISTSIYIFRSRMHHYIRTILNRIKQIRSRSCAVYNQRYSFSMKKICCFPDIHYIQCGISYYFAKHCSGLICKKRLDQRLLYPRYKMYFDSECLQIMKQIQCTSEQCTSCDYLIPCLVSCIVDHCNIDNR